MSQYAIPTATNAKRTRRESFLHFTLPLIGDEEIQAVSEVLRSGWLTTGVRAQEFEREFAEAVGASHAIALNSCTAALHLALEAVGLGPEDTVITVPFTFAATAEVVRYLGAHPKFVDVQPDTGNLNPALLEEAVTPRTRAIIAVHYAGQPCDMGDILDFAREHNLPVIEDAAHALPARLRVNGGPWRMIGTIGDLTCFSFYATKTITTGEGGMITTARMDWADRIRMMSLHGISRDAWRRYTAQGTWHYEIEDVGYKYNLTDIAASLGLAQLRKCDRFWSRRCEIADSYTRAFSDCEAIQLPQIRPDRTHAWHLYVIRLHLEQLRIDRAQFVQEMKARNIGTSVHFIPLHLHPYYRNTYGFKGGEFPVAEDWYRRCVSLPIYPGMSAQDVEDVVEAVLEIVRTCRR